MPASAWIATAAALPPSLWTLTSVRVGSIVYGVVYTVDTPDPEELVMSQTSASASAKPVIVPRWLVRTIWYAHRAAYRITGGRFGLRPSTTTQWGMLRLSTIGRRSGKARVAIVGYIVDGPNLIVPAMNGWADPEPAWWLNLRQDAHATVVLSDGSTRLVSAREAQDAEPAE